MNKTSIIYRQSTGDFNICPSNRPYHSDWSLIAEVDEMYIADAFVGWASKNRDLSNQPDKPWDYKGQKPSSDIIKEDWKTFESIISFYIKRKDISK